MSFIAMFLISPVAATTSEGLEWGVADNDLFTFGFSVIEEGVRLNTTDVNMTMNGDPGPLDDPLTDWNNIPQLLPDWEYANGSALGFEVIYFLGIIITGGYFYVPIGNYTLLTELFMASTFWNENSSIIHDGSNWGVSFSAVEDDSRMQVSVRYHKEDGFLSRYNVEMTNTTSLIRTSATLTRRGLGFDIIGFIQDNFLMVGIGVGVMVILGAVVCLRRR
jgi:hypothetical protein